MKIIVLFLTTKIYVYILIISNQCTKDIPRKSRERLALLYFALHITSIHLMIILIIYIYVPIDCLCLYYISVTRKKQIWSMQDTTQYMLGCSKLLLKNITIVVCFCGCRFCPIQFTFDKTQQPMSHRLPWICYRYCRTKGVSLQTSIQPCSGNIRNTRLLFFIKVYHYVC